MTGFEPSEPDDALAEALASYDDRLATGDSSRPEELDEGVDFTVFRDWSRLTAFLSIVERAWPRREDGRDRPTIAVQDCQTRQPVTEEALAHSSTGAADHEGRQFGRFQIIDVLGQGGFGIVFLAWDPALRRRLALKVPQPDVLMTSDARKRFEREALAAAGLDHPNIVSVYECGNVGAITYIAAAYIPGPTLSRWLSRQTMPVPFRDAARITSTLAQAVAHAHERGVLHRDLTPANILLQRSTNSAHPGEALCDALPEFVPRITDFSLAKLSDGLGPETRSGIPFGSPSYMAPEQAEGKLTKIGPSTDVYGLGSIFYELLTGRPPFCGENQLDTLRQVIVNEPPCPRRQRPGVPEDLEGIVLKCLEKEPNRRYATARELADDLDRYLTGVPTHARPRRRWQKLRYHAKRHPWALLTIAHLVLFAGFLFGGRHWVQRHLDHANQSAGRLEREIRDYALAARRAQYVADIRHAFHHIRDDHTLHADELLARHHPGTGAKDLRDFSWHYLRGQVHTERRTLTRAGESFHYVDFSPRGDRLVAAGKNGNVRIWDTKSWQPLETIAAAPAQVNVAAFAPDGITVATVDDEGKLKLWDAATGRCQLERQAHTGAAVIAQFTSDGESIVTGGRTDGLIEIWNRRTGLVRDRVRVDEIGLESAAVSWDGSRLATVGTHGVKLWEWPAKRLIIALPNTEDTKGVAFSHNGKTMATAHESGKLVRLWDTGAGALLREFRGHAGGVFAVVFSADDQTLVSASDDDTIRLWDVATGEERGVHRGHSGRVENLALTTDLRMVASTADDGTVKLWDLEPPRNPIKLAVSKPKALGFTGDGQSLLVFEQFPSWSISRWDLASASLREREPLNLRGSSGGSAFSRDGRLLAVANAHATITLRDVETGKQDRIHDPALGDVQFLEFSPDERFLLVRRAESDPKWLLWDRTGRRVVPFPWHNVRGSCWTAEQALMTELADGRLVCWNPKTEEMNTISLKSEYKPDCLIRSPVGGSFFALNVSPRKFQLWSSKTLEFEKGFAGHRGGQAIVAISPDAKTLASAGADKTIKLWDVATGEELLTLDGSGSIAWDLRFSPNGKALVTIGTSADNCHCEGVVLLYRTIDEQLPH